MAKRSDFAQKLLDDLRLRKERMATSSNSSKSSNPLAGDAYTYAKQTHRASGNLKTNEKTSFRTGTMHKRSNGGSKSFMKEEASMQIVPFGRGQNSEQIGDLSKALTFAFENGGRLKRMDSSASSSILTFLNQISRRSVDFGKMERKSNDHKLLSSASHFPILSHLHIEEISKGAQKLNQILRACSNGINFDKYSIEIGKELFKGAIDLEESLRMLVNLQDASEYMISPQRKNRITLLDEDEDEDDDDTTVKIAEQKQLDRPRFSFDEPLRNTHGIQEVGRSDLKQRLVALAYLSEVAKSNTQKQAPRTPNSISHKRSVSYGPDVKGLAAFSDQKNYSSSTKSKPVKGRIPNVIAKLMGLDGLPENDEATYAKQKDASRKQRMEGIISKGISQATTQRERKDSEYLAHPVMGQKKIQSYRIIPFQDSTVVSQTEKNFAIHRDSFEVFINDGEPPRKKVESLKAQMGLNKTDIRRDNEQNNNSQLNNITRRRKEIQQSENNQNHKKLKEQKAAEKNGKKEPILKHELQRMAPQTHKGSEAALLSQIKTGFEESMHLTEKIHAGTSLSSSQQNSSITHATQQPYVLRKFKPRDEKHQAREWEKHSTRKQKESEVTSKKNIQPTYSTMNLQKQHLQPNQTTHSRKGSMEAIDTMQTEILQIGAPHEDLASKFNIERKDLENRNLNPDASTRDLNFKLENQKTRIPQAMEENSPRVSVREKTKSTKAHKGDAHRKADEVMARRNVSPKNLAKPPKHQTSILLEVKQRKHYKLIGNKETAQVRISKSEEEGASIVKSNNSEASIQTSNTQQKPQIQDKEATNFHCLMEDEWPSLKEPKIQAPNGTDESKISVGKNAQQDQKLALGSNEPLNSHKIASGEANGTHEVWTNISHSSQQEHQEYSKPVKPEPLTENETFLKQTLIRSKLFLDTAEGLFRLNIPFRILHDGGFGNHDKEIKLVIDCGYEVMRRKGRSQELCVNPSMTRFATFAKVRTLDELVKELQVDLEKLKYYGKNGNEECVVEEYLPKMLVNDVYNRDPDINCMWDAGWNDAMFTILEKDDIIRDVEKYVLNGLLDEMTRDLLPV